MAIVKMKFINIVGPINKFDVFVREHILQNGIQLENAISVLGNVKGLYPFMEENPYSELMKTAHEIFEKMHLSTYMAPNVVCDYSVEHMENYIATTGSKVKDLLSQKEQIQAEISNNQQIITHLLPMQHVEVQLEHLFNLNFVKFRFGKLPRDSYKKLQTYLKDLEVFVIPVLHEADYEWIVYFTPAQYEEKTDSVFSSLYFERVRISGKVSGTPAQALVQLEEEITQLRSELEKIDREFNQYVKQEQEEFLRIFHTIRFLYEAFDVRKYAAHTQESFYISGWIPQKHLKSFTAEMDKDKTISYIIEDPDMVKTSRPPTELKNFTIFKPFESLVKIYGLPSYNEVDPTMFIAVTYLLLFGMMFGDVGQGAVIAAAGWYLYKKHGQDIGGIMLSAGITSVVFGCLYGSVFGYEHDWALWMHPLQPSNIPVIMGVSVGLGIFLISAAMFLNILNGIKSKNLSKIWFDKNGVAGFIFYWGIIVFVLYFLSKGEMLVPGIVMSTCLVLPLLAIAMKEPLENLLHQKKKLLPEDKGGFFAEAFFEMFDTILGFMSNTVSFVRVSAFALNHAGLFAAVLILAKMLNGVGSIIVVIVGNILVIGLEGLIVGIQDLRLGYYELFSRFFSGEGRPFTPVGVSSKME